MFTEIEMIYWAMTVSHLFNEPLLNNSLWSAYKKSENCNTVALQEQYCCDSLGMILAIPFISTQVNSKKTDRRKKRIKQRKSPTVRCTKKILTHKPNKKNPLYLT